MNSETGKFTSERPVLLSIRFRVSNSLSVFTTKLFGILEINKKEAQRLKIEVCDDLAWPEIPMNNVILMKVFHSIYLIRMINLLGSLVEYYYSYVIGTKSILESN